MGFALTCARYIVYASFATAAVHKQRVQQKVSMTGTKDIASEGESIQL